MQEPSPSPTLRPVSEQELAEGYLDGWFDDSVLVGDSIASGLNMFVTRERDSQPGYLGNLRIIGTSGMTIRGALAAEQGKRKGQVLYRSQFRTISNVVEITGAKRLLLMIGVRDLEYYTIEELIAAYGELISLIKADHPDLKIYVHSLMPTLKSFAMDVGVSYETHKKANEALKAYCEAQGYTYIELADYVRDEDGFLRYEYSGPDYSFHPNDLAKAIWVTVLRQCARAEYEAGLWQPE